MSHQPINTKVPESLGPILKQVVLELNMNIRSIRHEVHAMRHDFSQILRSVIPESSMFTKEELVWLMSAHGRLENVDGHRVRDADILRDKLLKLLELKKYE